VLFVLRHCAVGGRNSPSNVKKKFGGGCLARRKPFSKLQYVTQKSTSTRIPTMLQVLLILKSVEPRIVISAHLMVIVRPTCVAGAIAFRCPSITTMVSASQIRRTQSTDPEAVWCTSGKYTTGNTKERGSPITAPVSVSQISKDISASIHLTCRDVVFRFR
jgi:hypothetical protein